MAPSADQDNPVSTDCIVVELASPTEYDPIFQEKKEIICKRGWTYSFSIDSKYNGSEECILDSMIKVSRILNLNEFEFYFLDDDNNGPFSHRNEIEALNFILSTLKNVKNTQNTISVDNIIQLVVEKLASISAAETPIKTGIICEGDKEKLLLQWAKHEGIKSKIDVAVFDGLRGGRAVEDISVGDVVLEIPQNAIICEDMVLTSEMLPILSNKELSGETKALLWSMKERHNPASKFAPYFSSLPRSFNTGLSIGLSALKVLNGMMIFEEILQAKEHLRSQYDTVFPYLSDSYPDIFPKEYFTWEMFLWACELWYSNGLKIAFSDGTIKTCLVPMAGLLNHGACPHITRYSKINPKTGTLILQAARPCKTGEQIFLNYGAYPNSHFALFYGFSLDSKNPFDMVPVDLDMSDAPKTMELLQKLKLGHSHMIRGCWLSRSLMNPYGLPTRLLKALYIALAEENDGETSPDLEKVYARTEIFETLLSILYGLSEALDEGTSCEDEDLLNWDVQLATSFKNNQRKLIASASEACTSALKNSGIYMADEICGPLAHDSVPECEAKW